MDGTESVSNGDNPPEQILDYDWDIILDGEDPFTAAGFSDPSPDSLPLSIGDIEQILLNEDDDFGPVAGEGSFEEQDVGFDWSSLLLDSPCEASDSKCSSGGSEVEERDLVDPFQQKLDCVAQVLDSDNGDPVTKKRKRQLRNRDAAVRSRERKKMYVRDLELKSKYFESECTRLGVMLQFCLAENQALRFYLENNNKKAVGASSPRQESAVLLLESLLLGSLLWSLGIIFTCLFILPSRLLSTLLRLLPQKGQEDQNQASRIKAGREQKSIRICVFPTMMGKRYKASRSRLKYACH